MTPHRCATPDCGRPAVAAVMTTAARISIRTDRLTAPRIGEAWADALLCWGCVSAAVDQHLTRPPAGWTPSGPDDVAPCGTESAARRHVAHGQACRRCGVPGGPREAAA